MNDENRRAGAADLLAALHPSDPLPPFVRASGASYFTADGREFVDLNEMRVVLGQENEAFIRALTDALHRTQKYALSSQGAASFFAR
mgnify:CR=1 FL=1